jgi:hypothetical protein
MRVSPPCHGRTANISIPIGTIEWYSTSTSGEGFARFAAPPGVVFQSSSIRNTQARIALMRDAMVETAITAILATANRQPHLSWPVRLDVVAA